MIKNLSKNESICIIKQDKGRGVVIIDKSSYIRKCESLLLSDKFTHLSQKENRVFNPHASKPEKFYSTAKVQKVLSLSKDVNCYLCDLYFHIGTATYKTLKYLTKLMTRLKIFCEPTKVNEIPTRSRNGFM